VPRTASEQDIKEKALAAPGVTPHVTGRTVAKVIYVKGRMVSIVTQGR
jgi:leucyl-tRNA synthetase